MTCTEHACRTGQAVHMVRNYRIRHKGESHAAGAIGCYTQDLVLIVIFLEESLQYTKGSAPQRPILLDS